MGSQWSQRVKKARVGIKETLDCSLRGKKIGERVCNTCKTSTRYHIFACPFEPKGVTFVNCKSCRHVKERIKEEHKRQMMAIKDIHKGRRGFLLATGPSVRLQNIDWLKDEIVVGVNFAHKMTLPEWTPTYMVTADSKIMKKLRDEWEKLDTNIVCSDTVIMQTGYNASNLLTKRGISIYYRKGQFDFDCVNGVKIPKAYSTVGHLALPFAMWLGLNPIYLLGCDCTARGHAYDDKGVACPSAMTLWQQGLMPALATAREKAQEKGIRLLNATMGGNLHVLERARFTDLKPMVYQEEKIPA